MSLRDKALDASTRAYSPYSTAKVGAAIETTDGKVYQGCNIENASYGGTVCAERVAIWKAVSDGHMKLKRIYVYTKDGWPPCGLCLQVISEFADPSLEITLGNEAGVETTKKFKEFLPNAFTPEHLD
ncbi:cytidine deaminase [Peredibacter starrii]|uniref:Cytidine deaminase n=1 Tax=Peredibacter starrii TaxID=28202 RepID=A0AAX4HMQ4_9BACT|nr:cytidine deaminase [Peredibacter starrii]WPU64442.1 cytidine deaminase [Peredibacter starrii]